MPSPHLPRLTIAKKGFLLISLPLATQLLFGLAVLVNGRNAVAAHAWELHSQEVLGRAYGVKTSLLAAQSNLRGYVLSANPDFRARSVLAGKEVPTSIAALSRLVADNPSQTLLVRQMDRTAIPFLKFQTDNMLLVDEHRQMDAEQRIAQGAGNDLMDRFLVPMNGFLAEEQRLAKARHARAYNSNQTAQVTVEGGMALNLGLAGTLAFFFITGINRRLRVLTDNARRLANEEPLLPALAPGDEIAEVDRAFRDMARSLAEAIENLQHANREMEAFSYSVSHDLRAPLRAIDGFSRVVVEEYGPRLDEEGNRLLGVICRNATTMAQLIDDLLAFSRLSRQPVSLSNVDMRDLATSAFSAARPASGREIEFILGDLPPARGDGALLRQAFANLVSNAVKFTAPRSVARIEVGSTAVNGERVYFVKDNGVGFDMRYANKLFGVFQRLHEAAQFEGTGVGLAIVQRVIQRHGGRVWAESTLGEGATFYFTLQGNPGGDRV